MNQINLDLHTFGWSAHQIPVSTEEAFKHSMLSIASSLGDPILTRIGGEMIEELSPVHRKKAHPNSLSKIYSTGAFPLHVDTAHMLTPCRYILLGCLNPGKGARNTLLLDSSKLNLTIQDEDLLYTEPFRIKNGRNSFFGTILSNEREFLRFDPGCMFPMSAKGEKIFDFFSFDKQKHLINEFEWKEGRVLIINNWKILHGRAHSKCFDADRKLLRITII